MQAAIYLKIMSRNTSIHFLDILWAQTINLMLEDIAVIKPIRSIIVMAWKVTVFIYNHMHVLDWMRECTKTDLNRPRITRFATTFLSLQSFKEKKRLKSYSQFNPLR